MPAFDGRLAESQRWDVINFVRALGAAATTTIGPEVEIDRPSLVAPLASIAAEECGAGPRC